MWIKIFCSEFSFTTDGPYNYNLSNDLKKKKKEQQTEKQERSNNKKRWNHLVEKKSNVNKR